MTDLTAHTASSTVSRRAFLKLLGANLALAALPGRLLALDYAAAWPTLLLADLPERLLSILSRTPVTTLDERGRLFLFDRSGQNLGAVTEAQTQWSLNRILPADRLYPNIPWGIVVHWYGDPPGGSKSLQSYLDGFNSLKDAGEYETQTSAHFLVGTGKTTTKRDAASEDFGIVQTQLPDLDGTPFQAAHLMPLDYEAYGDQRQYFVQALCTLQVSEPAAQSLLIDLYTGRRYEPNQRTIAIELTGHAFDDPDRQPSDQQVANLIAVIAALMRRYQIPVKNILGHQELDLGKRDPGKKFLALVRLLLGIKALLEPDTLLKELVFGTFLRNAGNPHEAVTRYFQSVRSYLCLVDVPRRVYEWEVDSQFWLFYDRLAGKSGLAACEASVYSPVIEQIEYSGERFLVPENHAADDLYCVNSKQKARETTVYLAGSGVCAHAGTYIGDHLGNTAIFRHRLPNGAEILTVYGNLGQLNPLVPGRFYPQGTQLGILEHPWAYADNFLHFSVAYGAVWEKTLRVRPNLTESANRSWMLDRYLQPELLTSSRLTTNRLTPALPSEIGKANPRYHLVKPD